ncbi:MAG: hypothetical protein J7642_02125 [Cyanobacteria bacterium SBC]|nr:hypothetical protein [Cyanobacteria bacterium SBC]
MFQRSWVMDKVVVSGDDRSEATRYTQRRNWTFRLMAYWGNGVRTSRKSRTQA